MATNQLPTSTGITIDPVIASLQESRRIIKEVTEQSKMTLAEIQERNKQSKINETEITEMKTNETEINEFAKQVEITKTVLNDLAKQAKITETVLKELAKLSKIGTINCSEQPETTNKTEIETDEDDEMSEDDKEMDAYLCEENQRQIDAVLSHNPDELHDHLLEPCLWKRFSTLNYSFSLSRELSFHDPETNELFFINYLFEGADTVALIKIIRTPELSDIEKHIKKIESYRRLREKEHEKQTNIIGAIVGTIFHNKVKAAAIEAGLFVLVQSSHNIVFNVPEDFEPRIF
jgi:hypothetical protein